MSKAALAVLDRNLDKYPKEKPEEMSISEFTIGIIKREALQEARDEIASTCSEIPNNSEWISVEDRLPEINGKYICCASQYGMTSHLRPISRKGVDFGIEIHEEARLK